MEFASAAAAAHHFSLPRLSPRPCFLRCDRFFLPSFLVKESSFCYSTRKNPSVCSAPENLILSYPGSFLELARLLSVTDGASRVRSIGFSAAAAGTAAEGTGWPPRRRPRPTSCSRTRPRSSSPASPSASPARRHGVRASPLLLAFLLCSSGKSFVWFRCSNVLRACPLALFFSALLLFSDAEAFTFGSVATSLLILYSCKVLGIITELNLFLLICLCWCLLQTDVSVIKSVHHFPVPS